MSLEKTETFAFQPDAQGLKLRASYEADDLLLNHAIFSERLPTCCASEERSSSNSSDERL